MKQQTLFFLLFFSLALARGQSVVDVTGNTLQNTTHIFEYAVGQIAVATYNSSGNELSQGVLQPYFEIVSIDGPTGNGFTLSAYPNPATYELILETNYAGFDALEIYNSLGQLISRDAFTYQPVSVAHLAMGTYYIRISDTEKNFIQSIKIAKQ